MAEWADLFKDELVCKYGERVDAPAFKQRFEWVLAFSERAKTVLAVEHLQSMAAPEVYKELKALTIPECPIRLTNLGRANSAQQVVEALVRLLATPGGFEAKYRAAKFPQAGVVTISEILCVSRPHRFICRNRAFSRALAQVVPFYSVKALEELGYSEFMDICSELVKVLLAYLEPEISWAAGVKYLLLYATLTEK